MEKNIIEIDVYNNAIKFRENIIKEVYQYDSNHNFIGGYEYFYEYIKEHQELSIYFLYHYRFMRLLWSKYNGRRYKPERFDRIVLDNESDVIL